MIILDTHIWIWWVDENPKLKDPHREQISEFEHEGLGVSAISCWEIAKSVAKGRLEFSLPVAEWFEIALAQTNTHLIPLLPIISVESTQLPGKFHQDPADEIIVATARVHNSPLAKYDSKISKYDHVRSFF